MQAEVLGDFFKNWGEKWLVASEKFSKNVFKKHPGQVFDVTAEVASAVAPRNLKAASSTKPDVINIYHTGKE